MTEIVLTFYPEEAMEWLTQQRIPISTWRYRDEWYAEGRGFPGVKPEQRFLGPMAQDVQAKFPSCVVAEPGTGYLYMNMPEVCRLAGCSYTGELFEVEVEASE
jgi:hypothetical protein